MRWWEFVWLRPGNEIETWHIYCLLADRDKFNSNNTLLRWLGFFISVFVFLVMVPSPPPHQILMGDEVSQPGSTDIKLTGSAAQWSETNACIKNSLSIARWEDEMVCPWSPWKKSPLLMSFNEYLKIGEDTFTEALSNSAFNLFATL